MSTVRREYLLRGVVQGVGFRPHVAVVAARHRITGLCGNDDLQVFIEAQAAPDALDAFLADLLATLPPLARVIDLTRRDLTPQHGEEGFRIVASRHLPGVRTLIPPDVATCPDCLAEMADPTDRRHRYAFTTCTNCGPRLTIIEDLPYDRAATTMRRFPMCPDCAAEYTDPTDRRFHAQPISCYACGPRLWLARPGDDAAERPVAAPATPAEQDAVIAEARRRLLAGEIVAVKGLGGFHLMCDARDAEAVDRLRSRKRRAGKPFAVMVRDAGAAAGLAVLSAPQQAQLGSPARPILIAPKTAGYDLADAVAPDSDDVGLMLPYAPLHTLLLDPADGAGELALVATSGNLSEEPLCHTNADALDRLSAIADSFLLHDRDIAVPVEDSVLLALPEADAVPLRRSRGYAPLPLALPRRAERPADGAATDAEPVVLAVGGELKNTFALVTGDLAFASAHVGDMGSLASQRAFEASVRQLTTMQRREPEVVVCDLHPGYATTGWAERYVEARPGVDLLRVQHHHAHALALLAEHGIADGPVVVAALDGTGYGDDAGHPGPSDPPSAGPAVWGGEILVLGSHEDPSPWSWRRAWHVPYFPLVGGDRAVRQPWRIAQGLAAAWHLDIGDTAAATVPAAAERRLVASQLDSGRGTVPTSSTGRLFDAAAAMLGLCLEVTYEAQAAMVLERAAARWAADRLRPSSGPEPDEHGSYGPEPDQHRSYGPEPDQHRSYGPEHEPYGAPAHGSEAYRVPSPAPFNGTDDSGGLRAVFVDLLDRRGATVEERAWRFHRGLAEVVADRLVATAAAAGTATVGLTGGVAVNRLFSASLVALLRARGLRVLTHRVVPPNDGGLCLGQAWAGRLAWGRHAGSGGC
ncbi:carbamoyltransferase HypF [Raineyella sp. LH-20]|uniref:carbamoyltransferase HypF n=1 Tax=Raineyella sp. LH-20 TaxID=3081204 RepID=UPI002955DF6F|nr:carbamoyltransferase HypF [Raineyella sp. LH-20]WOP18686.1 carbamoyltransferase HypF [Raineyella sp. LH-20]